MIALHGAALGTGTAAGGALIEIGHQKEPLLIFMATALRPAQVLLVHAEKGTHASGLTADVNDVKELAAKAVAAYPT